ncbi:MAG: shikimate dehydrogenase, partial [Deltaproteobacteria bacterium]|nr:shikimate dehydrogenase [Kofleriaceae bacterium]
MSGADRSITSSTRLAAVLGWPVAHSKSPALHNAAFAAAGVDAVYVALAVPPAELATV